MKILFNCGLPFALTRGGQQIGIECTQAALQAIGIEVEPVRWWDDKQTGDIIHYFGRMPALQIEQAHQKGIKVVMGEILTSTGSRSKSALALQRCFIKAIRSAFPTSLTVRLEWDSYRLADAIVAMTTWERHLMHYLFDAPLDRIVIVPNGVEALFLQPVSAQRGPWLVCTATITPRKRVLELVQAAVLARTPVWIIGKAYTESDPYAGQLDTLARQNPQLVRWESPAMSDREGLAKIYRAARGFVLLSAMETRSLAAEEAAACGCPLLLTDLPWARSTYGESARYCPLASPEQTAHYLKQFYEDSLSLKPPPPPPTWADIAGQLKAIYERVLNGSR